MLIKISLTLIILIVVCRGLYIKNPEKEVKNINDFVGVVLVLSLLGLIVCVIYAIWTVN